MTSSVQGADLVERHRGRLFGIAYRMLGQVQEAEDLVQETYLRWHQADRGDVAEPLAWLVAVVTRLAIDRLRRAAAERTSYVGQWLPEPVAVGRYWAADEAAEMRSDLSLALLVLLERLAPEERAAFILREVFDESYPAIAAVLEKSEAAARQIVHRARQRVRADHARFHVDRAAIGRVFERFRAAVESNDKDAVMALFTDDATFTSDGGGRVAATINVVHGPERIARLLLGLEQKWGHRFTNRVAEINGEPAVITDADGALAFVTALETDGDRIRRVFRVLNPDKLRFV